MKKYNFILIVLTVLIVLFSCNASTVIIDGTFEGNMYGRTVVIHLKRQSYDNAVLGVLKSDLLLKTDLVVSDRTVPSGTFFVGTLYDAEDSIILRMFLGGYVWNFMVLDNGSKLESVNTTSKVFFKRK